jgi:hypothetical protein
MPNKLGKLAPKANPKTLLFSKFLRADAPPPPPNKLWREYKIPKDAWQMFGNDTAGDCTCAAIAHMLMLVTAHVGKMVTPQLSDVIGAYSAITGYDPSQTDANGNNPTDNGAAITDVLAYWQKTGLAGHKILAWAAIDYSNVVTRHQGVYIFGANDIGVQLPAIAQQQFSDGVPWDVVSDDGGIEGGHCIVEAGYGKKGSDMVTWGNGQQKATNAWSAKYVDEAYVVITQDWINNASGLAPNALNMSELTQALAAVAA